MSCILLYLPNPFYPLQLNFNGFMNPSYLIYVNLISNACMKISENHLTKCIIVAHVYMVKVGHQQRERVRTPSSCIFHIKLPNTLNAGGISSYFCNHWFLVAAEKFGFWLFSVDMVEIWTKRWLLLTQQTHNSTSIY